MLVVNTALGTGLHVINTAAGIAGDRATGWRTEKSWLDYRQQQKISPSPERPDMSGAHPASYTIGKPDVSPEYKVTVLTTHPI